MSITAERSLNERLDPVDSLEFGDLVGIGLLLENCPSGSVREGVVRSRAERAARQAGERP